MKYWNCIRSVIVCSCGFGLLTIVQDLIFRPPITMGQRYAIATMRESEGVSVQGAQLSPESRLQHSMLEYLVSNVCNITLNAMPTADMVLKFRLHPQRTSTREAELIVLVISFHTHSDFRNAIRGTWAHNPLRVVRVVFVLGVHADTYWNKRITEEHAFYGDILQVNAADTYRNLPKKILLAFQWVLGCASDTKYLMKTDDDVYLSLPNVMALVNVKTVDNVIVGAYNPHSPVSRNVNDDWGVSRQDYSPGYFPPYVSGGSYFMSVSTAYKLVDKINTCRQIHIEDVFITGILAGAAGIVHQSHIGFSFWTSRKATPCEILNGRVNSVNMSPTQIYTLHNGIINATSELSCPA